MAYEAELAWRDLTQWGAVSILPAPGPLRRYPPTPQVEVSRVTHLHRAIFLVTVCQNLPGSTRTRKIYVFARTEFSFLNVRAHLAIERFFFWQCAGQALTAFVLHCMLHIAYRIFFFVLVRPWFRGGIAYRGLCGTSQSYLLAHRGQESYLTNIDLQGQTEA